MSNTFHIKFLDQPSSVISHKRLIELYTKNVLKFDVELVSSDGRKVSAHRHVLSMFSKHLEQMLYEIGPSGFVQIKLKGLRFEIIEKVVELFYLRETFVSEEQKPMLNSALKFLKSYDIEVSENQFRKKLKNGDGFVYSIAAKNIITKPTATVLTRGVRVHLPKQRIDKCELDDLSLSDSSTNGVSPAKRPVVLTYEKKATSLKTNRTVQIVDQSDVDMEASVEDDQVDENTEYANLCSDVARIFGTNDLRDILPGLDD